MKAYRFFVLPLLLLLLCLLGSCTYASEDGLTYRSVKGGYEVTGYTGEGHEIVIPSVANGRTVVGIAPEAFHGVDVRRVYMPDSVTYIGEKAFYKCKFLSEVELGRGLASLGSMAFTGCGIERMYFPGTLADWFRLESYNWKTLYAEGFSLAGEAAPRELCIPDFVTEIPDYAFRGAPITALVLPDSVVRVGAFAFHQCESLRTVSFGNGLREIGHRGFGQSGLTGDLWLPDSLQCIRDFAFGELPHLERAFVPIGVSEVGAGVFGNAGLRLYCEAASEPFSWDPMWSYFKEDVTWGVRRGDIAPREE